MPGNLGIIASGAGGVAGAPAYRSSSQQRVIAATTTNDPGAPSGSVGTDLLIAVVTCAGAGDTIATPSGWTLIGGGPLTPSGGTQQASYLFKSLPGATRGTSFTKTGTANAWRVGIDAYSGASDVDVITTSVTASNGSTIACGAITTTVANTLGVAVVSTNGANDASSITSFTLQLNAVAGGAPGITTGRQVYATAGTTSAVAGTLTGNSGQVRYHLALKP